MNKSLKLFTLTISSFLAIFQLSCNGDDSNSDCKSVNCTDVFITINVSIKDQNQNPVALDSFEVTNLKNGTDLTISLSPSKLVMAQQLGQYPLVTDGTVNENQELELQFKGFINNQEVVISNYTVGADCCHVFLVSGDLELVL